MQGPCRPFQPDASQFKAVQDISNAFMHYFPALLPALLSTTPRKQYIYHIECRSQDPTL